MKHLIDGALTSGDVCLAAQQTLTVIAPDFSTGRWLWSELSYRGRHNAMVDVRVFVRGEAEPRSLTHMSFYPDAACRFVFDLHWLDGQRVFFPRTAGRLKATSFTRRIEPQEIDRFELVLKDTGHEQALTVGPFRLEAEAPPPRVEAAVMLDALGQNARATWPGKMRDEAEMVEVLRGIAEQGDPELPAGWPDGWTRFGGSARDRFEATGYFRTHRDEHGRWWLVDPDGGGFFSAGLDCVRPGIASAVVPGTEHLLDWHPTPEADGGRFAGACGRGRAEHPPAVDFAIANLIRAFGPSWHEAWEQLTAMRLRRLGFNTVANWSDIRLAQRHGLPYVLTMGHYPTTDIKLFRDFPDVYDPAFAQEANRYADQLEDDRDDRLLIGYFMSNEPNWGFGKFNLAAEMLEANPGTHTRRALAAWLRSRYDGDAAKWSAAWGLGLQRFEQVVDEVVKRAADRSPSAGDDLWEFSREMVRRFVHVPADACRAVDPHHLNLGLRYAWIASDLFYDAAEAFDVFSINCYQMGPPLEVLEQIASRTGKPVVIGEYHFGALDRGLPGTGLKAVASQAQRGVAYRYFLEQCAAHPHLVGAHYFTLYDQSYFGRFDGENWNIGFADVCHRLYPELASAARASHERLYDVRAGRATAFDQPAQETARIAN